MHDVEVVVDTNVEAITETNDSTEVVVEENNEAEVTEGEARSSHDHEGMNMTMKH